MVQALSGEKDTRQRPVNLIPADGWLFEKAYEHHHPRSGYSEITDALLTRFRVKSPLEDLPDSWLWDHKTTLSREHAYLNARDSLLSNLSKDEEISEGLWLANFQGDNYFHWLTESLPRLLLAREAGINSPILLPRFARVRSFVKESLELLNETWVELEPHKQYRVRHLFLTSKTAAAGNPRADILSKVRERLLDSVAESSLPEHTRERASKVWLTRKSVGRRHLVNESDLIEKLQKHGFIVVDPGKLSIAEQVKLFSASKTIAGVHGAGLTNMLFMEPEGRVIEVRAKEDSHNNCYFAMASACSHSYGYLLAKPLTRKKHSDLVLDVSEHLAEIID